MENNNQTPSAPEESHDDNCFLAMGGGGLCTCSQPESVPVDPAALAGETTVLPRFPGYREMQAEEIIADNDMRKDWEGNLQPTTYQGQEVGVVGKGLYFRPIEPVPHPKGRKCPECAGIGYHADTVGRDPGEHCSHCDGTGMAPQAPEGRAPTEGLTSEKIIQAFGDAATDVFEQMERGNWEDDHDHPVKNNTAMVALCDAVKLAIEFRAAPEGTSPKAPAGLLPCPFCGTDPKYGVDVHDTEDGETVENHWVHCPECSVSIPSPEGSAAELIAWWNRRAPINPWMADSRPLLQEIASLKGQVDALAKERDAYKDDALALVKQIPPLRFERDTLEHQAESLSSQVREARGALEYAAAEAGAVIEITNELCEISNELCEISKVGLRRWMEKIRDKSRSALAILDGKGVDRG